MKIKAIVTTVLAVVICLSFSQLLSADEKKIMFNTPDGVKEVLSAYIGKRLAIKTDAGEALEGTVIKVGDQLVHIEKLSGKDFYDAVVRIDRINAVVIRVRGN